MLSILAGIDYDYVASIAAVVIVWSLFWGWVGYRIGRWAKG